MFHRPVVTAGTPEGAGPAVMLVGAAQASGGYEIRTRGVRTQHAFFHRSTYNREIWKPAVEGAGITPTSSTGMHALRHFYASALLDAGESVRALATYLGHSDPGFTLRVYTHLMPSSDDRTRRAIDNLFGADQNAPDGPEAD